MLASVVVLGIALAILAYHNIRSYPWILDDAFISFRYAENFAAGEGLDFNPGERVEGYTTFTWVLMLGVGKAVGFDPPSLSRVLGCLFALVCLLLLAFSHRFIPAIDSRGSLVAVLLLASCGVFTPWAVSGMEVTLFTFLILLEVLIYLSALGDPPDRRRLLLTGFFGALAALTRPEGVLVFVVICLDLVIDDRRRRQWTFHYPLFSFVALYIPYFSWRFLYYGYLLPNTFYAKVGSTFDQVIRGGAYALRFAVPAAALLLAALIGLASRNWRRALRRLRVLPLLFVLYTLYVISVGGDCMPAHRFFAPVIPWLCLLAALSLVLLLKRWLFIWLAAGLMTLYGIYQIHHDYDIADLISRDRIAWRGREVGLWLKDHASPNAVVATNTSGSVPYFSGLRTVDMLGMNDEQIAHRQIETMGQGFVGHEKGDGAYVLSRRPEYIILGSANGSREPAFPSDKELFEMPAFHRLYRFQVYRLPSGRPLQVYELRGDTAVDQ